MARHANNAPDSPIVAINTYTSYGTLGPRFGVWYKNDKFEEIMADQLDVFLNEAADKNGDGTKRRISKEVEEALAVHFIDVLKFEAGKYIYFGPKSISESESRFLATEMARKTDYDNSPNKIQLLNLTQVIDEKGKIWPIGLTPQRGSLNVIKLGRVETEQGELNKAIVQATCEFSLLPYINYRTNAYGLDNAHGYMPIDYFDNMEHYNFRSKIGVKPSDAILSVFKAQTKALTLECSGAIDIIQYKALLDFLGEVKFNELFTSSRLHIGHNKGVDNALESVRTWHNHDFKKFVKSPLEMLDTFNTGDALYISNISSYSKRHYIGGSSGFNVIYLGKNVDGKPQFGGLFTDKHLHTYEEILNLLIQEYNKFPYDLHFSKSQKELLYEYRVKAEEKAKLEDDTSREISDLVELKKITEIFSSLIESKESMRGSLHSSFVRTLITPPTYKPSSATSSGDNVNITSGAITTALSTPDGTDKLVEDKRSNKDEQAVSQEASSLAPAPLSTSIAGGTSSLSSFSNTASIGPSTSALIAERSTLSAGLNSR
jgi:hypothetical protein